MAVRLQYEDFEPEFEESEDPEAYMLQVYLPDFLRQQLKVTYDESTKKIKTRGERPLGNNRWSRFEKEFSIPDTCTLSGIRGKFEKNVLIITMPKKVIPQEAEAKRSAQETASSSKVDPPQGTPPKTTNDDNIQKPKEEKPARFPTPIPSRAAADPKSQKGQQDTYQKLPSTADTADNAEKEREKKDVEPMSPPKPFSKRTRKSSMQKSIEEDGDSKAPAIAERASQDHWNREKDLVSLAKEVMGKLAKRVKEDENSKQSLVNAGVAAVVIVALGAYIAHTIGSRQSKN